MRPHLSASLLCDQAEEIRALAAELDRLRLKTYPTFIEPVSAWLLGACEPAVFHKLIINPLRQYSGSVVSAQCMLVCL